MSIQTRGIPEMCSGDTFVWLPEDSDRVLLRLLTVHWFCGLKRWDDSHITLINFRHWLRNDDKMANTRTQKSQIANTDFIGFVNIRLSDEEFGIIDKALKSKIPPTLEESLEFLLNLGKISINYYKGSLNVTLTVLEGDNAGYAVSAFSDNLLETVSIVRFKCEKYGAEFAQIFKSGGQRSARG